MSGSGTRRTTILKRRAGKTARLIFYAKRASVVLVVLGGISYGLHSVANSGWFSRTEENTVRSFHEKSVNAGFEIRNLLIDGRQYTKREELKSALGIEKNTSIFVYDLAELQQRLSVLPWVKSATVERRLPDTIYIKLQERIPVALWQRDKKVALVDAEGSVLTEQNLGAFKDMLVVTGESAPQNAPELMSMLVAEPDLRGRIEIARWIGNRRWDIKLKNGITVRLPENDAELAIKRLTEAQTKEKIMERQVEAIDLRDPVRIVIQTAPGAAQKFEAGYHKEKNI